MRQKLPLFLKLDHLWLLWGLGEKKYYNNDNYPIEQLQLTLSDRIIFAMMMSQKNIEDLLEVLKTTHTAFLYWMEGKRTPKPKMIQMIAKELGVEYDWLKGQNSTSRETAAGKLKMVWKTMQ